MLIPADNAKDLAEIPDNLKRGLDIIALGTVDEVLKAALVSAPEPIEWDENAAAISPSQSDEDVGDVITH